MLALGIEGRSCLIKEKNLRLADQGASDGNALLLAARKLDTTLANKRLKALWEYGLILDEIERVCFIASGLNISVGNFRLV